MIEIKENDIMNMQMLNYADGNNHIRLIHVCKNQITRMYFEYSSLVGNTVDGGGATPIIIKCQHISQSRSGRHEKMIS